MQLTQGHIDQTEQRKETELLGKPFLKFCYIRDAG